ncbi:MAG: ATP-binding protein [bacterium]
METALTSFSLLALAAVLAALALFVWRARPDSAVNRWFTLFTIFGTCWVIGIAALQIGVHLNLWGRFAFASATMIPASFLGFIRSYPTVSRWPSPVLVTTTLGLGAIIALLSLVTPLMVYGNVMTPQGLVRKTGPLYPLFIAYFLVTSSLALIVFVSKWRRSRSLARAQLQYLAIGLTVTAAGGITTNLILPALTGKSTHTWIGPYFTLLFVVIVGHAIIRHRLMDLRLVIRRGIAHGFAIAIVSALVLVSGHLLTPGWRNINLPIPPDVLAVGLVILLMLSEPVQRLFGRVIDPYLYRGRFDSSMGLPDITNRLSHLMQPAELCAEIRQILANAFVPESFTMIVHSPDDGRIETLSVQDPTFLELITARGEVARLLETQLNPSVLLVNPGRESGTYRSAHEALRFRGIEIVVALGRRGQRLGMIFLGQRRSGDAYFTQDLAFLESLAGLVSISLENALLYRQRIQMLEYSDRLLESLNSAVVAVDATGRITSFNPAAKTLLGLQAAAPMSLEVLPAEVGWALAFAIRGIWIPREVEATIHYPSRGSVPVIISAAALRANSQHISGALAVVTDFSSIKALEHNQRRVERLALMARFYAGIAHEIRSPLASISNFVAMLQDRFDDPEYRDTAVRLLPMEVGRIVRLADRLRLMAPSEGGTLNVIALPPLLRDIVAIHAPAASESGVRIVLLCPDDLPQIHGDRGQLVQLFVNLLNNAVEAMPNGGDVSIEAVVHPRRSGGPTVAVHIIDSGVGIDPSTRPKIFEPFFTTKPSGTGLGLSICREIADFHHAALRLVSRLPDPGTVAQVEFPVVSVNGRETDGKPTAPTQQDQSELGYPRAPSAEL